MTWRIEFADTARKQLKKLGHAEAKRIHNYLRNRIEPLDDPRRLGKPLKAHLSQLWRYRVGDYRIICEHRDEILVVLVVRIGHRKAVYR